MSTTPTPAGAAVPTPAPEPTVDAVHDHLAQWVLDPEYPCLGARAVFNRDRARIVTTGRLGSASSSLDVYQALRDFGDDADPDEGFTSLVAAFGGQAPPSERAFEDRLWTTLQHLHDFDDTPWNAEVSSDPADVDFSFSIGGIAYFVVGLHPGASRDARRTPWPVLVFNLHSQFEELKASGRYERMRDLIRSRDLDLQGSVNPMVADHGEQSEARQYSGRAVDPSWRAPLENADMAP
ncbi:guanitoxin biosynthesis heme-dependent pre-guanitoxin N-hydroxylase GntA [Knoellia sp. LjRoot47]|uniref:guanitoxin biosynthesis heme-dependent pre-guanitoxin N-hydroxylase GntA n=1 Tax=Knoellia sp. LjRoot47 TaxID=3342330 RepID=UPI003ECD5585